MVHSVKFQSRKSKDFQRFQEFQEFTFIGHSGEETTKDLEQLPLSSRSNVLSKIAQGSLLEIEKVCVARNVARQLRNLDFKPGKQVQLVSKGKNGSIVVSLDDQLIGISSDVAAKIIVILAS